MVVLSFFFSFLMEWCLFWPPLEAGLEEMARSP